MDSCESKRIALTLMRGLVEGQDMARQLHYLLLQKPVVGDDGFAAAGGVLDNILASFTEVINLITHASHHFSRGGGDHGDAGSEDSTHTNKNNKRPRSRKKSDHHHRSRCFSKTSKSSSETWTKVSPTIEDDGQAWRKYGQKEILNSKFPRSYFRCKHKYEKGCKATKQIQRMEDDHVLLYKTTYMGLHTCKLADHTTKTPPPQSSEDNIIHSLLFPADDNDFTQQQQQQQQQQHSSSTCSIYGSSFVGVDVNAAATTTSLLFDADDDDFGVFFLDDPDTTFS